MSYLNYRKSGDVDRLDLVYPQTLISVSLQNVKITNMYKCVNLRNLYSNNNTYNQKDFSRITQLKRIFSQNDTFDSPEDSLLRHIFRRNRLTYVYLRNGNNIISEMTLYRNIADLKFMYIECFVDRSYSITLDITKEFPQNLLVFEIHVKHREKSAFRRKAQNSLFGILDGPRNRVQAIEEQLIHSHKMIEGEEGEESEDE